MKTAYDPKSDFVACKQALDGSHRQWGHVFGLTREQARNTNNFPLGILQEPDGTKYVWHYYHSAASRAA